MSMPSWAAFRPGWTPATRSPKTLKSPCHKKNKSRLIDICLADLDVVKIDLNGLIEICLGRLRQETHAAR